MINYFKSTSYTFFLVIFLFSPFTIAKTIPFNPGLNLPFSFKNTPSAWYEYNQALYSKLLSSSINFDMLVVPFQVRDHAIDQIGRSLMSRYLTDGISSQFEQKIPEIDLVEQALGEHKRRYEIEKIFELANDLKVNKIVTGYVGHDNKGKMSIAILTYQPSPVSGNFENKHKYILKEWNNLSISDEKLPSLVFNSKLNEIIQFIVGKKSDIYSVQNPVEKLPGQLPTNFGDIFFKNKINSPLLNAYFYQLVGILHPEDNLRRRERLFEKSLVALNNTSPKSEYYNALRARAYHYLHRRPTAKFLLKNGSNSPESMSISAILDGNLPTSIKQTKKIKNRLMYLLSAIESETLFYKYNKIANRQLTDQIKFNAQDWKYLLERRLNDLDPWDVEPNIQVKAILDDVFPVATSNINKNINANILQGKKNPEDFDLSVVEHLKLLLTEKPKEWCCSDNGWHVSRWEYLNLLNGIAESNLLKKLNKIIKYQNRPDSGYELFEKFEMVYQGHPQFTYKGLNAVIEKYNRANSLEKEMLAKKSNDLLIGMYAWSNGQREYLHEYSDFVFRYYKTSFMIDSPMASNEENPVNLNYAEKALFITDFPVRSYWRPLAMRTDQQKQKFYTNAIRYTASDFEVISHLQNLKSNDNLMNISKILKNRFLGHPKRLEILANTRRILGDKNGEIKIYLDAIKAHTYNWVPYFSLGKIMVEQGKYKDAEEIFSKFPIFNNTSSEDAVRTSNRAFEAANLFYNRGELKSAVSLFKIASNTNTGSNSDFGSKLKLAIINGDYISATQLLYTKAKRYNNDYDYGLLMAFLHIMGDHKSAWAIFDSLVGKIDGPYLWLGPLIGHRTEQKSYKDIVEWTRNPRYSNQSFNGNGKYINLSNQYMFRAMTLDRPVDDKILATMDKDNPGPIGLYYSLKSFDAELISETVNMVPVNLIQINDADSFWYPYQMIARLFFSKNAEANNRKQMIEINNWANNNLEVIEKNTGGIDYQGRFNLYLATAILEAKNNSHRKAIEYLSMAFRYRPEFKDQDIDPMYQLVEISEWLYRVTKYDNYISQALTWADKYQTTYPIFSWPYAFKAKYSNDKNEQIKSLAIAQYLDPQSYWLSTISNVKKEAARKWFKDHNPFSIEELKKQNGV